jgi:hypothetical protein
VALRPALRQACELRAAVMNHAAAGRAQPQSHHAPTHELRGARAMITTTAAARRGTGGTGRVALRGATPTHPWHPLPARCGR